MMNLLRNKINEISTEWLYHGSKYRKPLADLPPKLFTYWQRTAAFEFKGIPQDAFFFARAAEGLLMFFDCVARSGKQCGLPSKAADSVWHAWVRFAPEHLARFCLTHFGRTIAHTEGSDMGLPMNQALAHTLVAARELEGLPVAGLNVPKLFSLDRRVRMPEGYAYSLSQGQVAYRDMDAKGRGTGEVHLPDGLSSAALLGAGLVSIDAYRKYQNETNANGGGCGSGCGSSASDGGGGGCDGGGGCGSSCGGGCGGGCG
ncbi:hypothetical protein [Massilia sp. CF038]|uniref:hypothetical protein n=1 Tax=Massilia sp. CF038 TaxID=1881045 RepID=UPI0009221A6E|nr:hypothetical protein [Massilia sp. CF038]SHH27497.1 hypothetical protein SAMN05428948_3625 [Massilia sp. CF038]